MKTKAELEADIKNATRRLSRKLNRPPQKKYTVNLAPTSAYLQWLEEVNELKSLIFFAKLELFRMSERGGKI